MNSSTAKLRNNERARLRKGDAKEQDFEELLIFETAKQRKGEMALSGHHTNLNMRNREFEAAVLWSCSQLDIVQRSIVCRDSLLAGRQNVIEELRGDIDTLWDTLCLKNMNT